MYYNVQMDVGLKRSLEEQIRRTNEFWVHGKKLCVVRITALEGITINAYEGGGGCNAMFSAVANMGNEISVKEGCKADIEIFTYDLTGYAQVEGEKITIVGKISAQKK